MYPPVPTLIRRCVTDYKVPDSDLIIEKNTRVMLPILGIHHDPSYFADPETFMPDRFNDENKGSIKPFTYLPFGDGPRNCIGIQIVYT